jgi:uncharacterized membrane protein YhaH (DUF805 family)
MMVKRRKNCPGSLMCARSLCAQQGRSGPKSQSRRKDKFWLVTYSLLIIGCAVLYFLLTAKLIPLPKEQIDLAGRFLRAVALIALVLALAQAISVYAIGRIEDASMRFTLNRIEHLLVTLAIAAIAVSI